MVDNRQSTLLTPTVPLYNGSPFKPKNRGGGRKDEYSSIGGGSSGGGGGSSSGGGSTQLPQSTIETPTQAAQPPIDPAGAYEVTVDGQGYSMRGVEAQRLLDRQAAIDLANKRREEEQKKEQFRKDPFNLIGGTYINRKVVDVARDNTTGKDIPITEVKAYDYSNIGKFFYYKERDATTDEEKEYRDYASSLQYREPEQKGFFGGVKDKITRSDFFYKYEQTSGEKIIKDSAVDFVRDKTYYGSRFVGLGENTSKFAGGVASSIIPQTRGELLTDTALYGIGFGLGAGVRIGEAAIVEGSVKLASKFPKASKIISKAPTTFKFAEVGTGLYLTGGYIISKGSQIYNQKDYSKKGETFGTTIKEVVLVGGGFGGGSKFGDMVLGKITTRGLKEIPVEKLIPEEVLSGAKRFPEAPQRTQLSLFQKNALKFELLGGDRAGGFHASPSRWWNKDFTAAAGTSELPGTYFGAYVSPNFLKLGSSSGSYFPRSIKDVKLLFQPRGIPRVAYSIPEGFREVGFSKVSPYKLGEQEFVYKFKKKAKPGFMDLPGMKTEIEAIARVDAGSYVATGKSAKFNVNGVNVGIDVFKYERLSSNPPKVSRPRGSGSKRYNPAKYSEPVSIPRYTPTSLSATGIRSLSRYSSTNKRSYVSSGSRSSRGSSISRISYSSSPISYRSSPESSSPRSSRSSSPKRSSSSSSYFRPTPIPKISIPKFNLGIGKQKGRKKKGQGSDIIIRAEDYTTRALRGIRV